MDTDFNGPDAVQLLRMRMLEVDVKSAEKKADDYRELILSLVSADASASIRPASQQFQIRAIPQPSSEPSPARERLGPTPGPSSAPAPASSPVRRERLARAFRRELQVEVPAVRFEPSSESCPARERLAPTPSSALAPASSPASRGRERSTRAFRREIQVEIPAVVTPRPTDPILTRSQALISQNDGARATTRRSHGVSTISISTGSIHVPDFIQAIFEAAGLSPYSLSWGETERANITPKIHSTTLSRAFGSFWSGRPEWPECGIHPRVEEDHKYLFCANLVAQPFAPTSVGHHGLALLLPEWTLAPQDDEDGHVFPVFVSGPEGSVMLEYKGDYTKVPLRQKTIEWSLLPFTIWVKRFYCSNLSAGRALRARIKLRDILKREPSVTEVQVRMRVQDKVRHPDFSDAFLSGKEKMQIVGIKCERYNSYLASTLQNYGTQ